MADRFCQNCGHTLRPDQKFCGNCGKGIAALIEPKSQRAAEFKDSPNQNTQKNF
ncbi:zinc ribbon domain-containing protein [Sporolactobacillus sp. CPB3-1]|uniref:Zinc ribbon domain-containing protein n=1 Tax=Sporolactobacillus mangiferae TaxID=2940498 RepID=A0ABT0MD14_9BACL|nr:zinc ribbon domain-containing protein [Sporolactobacillus mangiferae]MCL1632766.1 zinc ribbon domain-containing protein [Sporolactobacillus mangiferae]